MGEYWRDSGGILERQWVNIGETVVQDERLCDEVETVGEYWRDSGTGRKVM